jgi:tripartite-type tricarboxylate transporter receptor subunit TctC
MQFTPIGVLLQSPLVLVVPASSPVKNFAQFAELVKAKAKEGKGIDYATPGSGSLVHVATELLRERLGSPVMNHVPYKGSGPAVVDVMAGRIDAMFDATSVFAPYIKSGQVRPILVTSAPGRFAARGAHRCRGRREGLRDHLIIGLYGRRAPAPTS